MERHPLYALLLVFVLSVPTVCGNEYTEMLSCPKNQKAFNGSCYEFVTLQMSFVHGQARCENSGGHLAFIHNEETQQFLQKYLQPESNWWIGLASTSFSLSSKDTLFWLDGSEVSYSNYLGSDVLGTGCGYISKGADFHWGATNNCSQEFFFICEFESGQSLACLDNHAVLKCDSGQVIEIDESFYGRNTMHYCRANSSLLHTPAQDRCSWGDVVSVVSDLCHGLQACKVPANTPAFGEPCPQMGSYLYVKYHCKDEPHSSARNGTKSSPRLKRGGGPGGNMCTCNDLPKSKNVNIAIKCLTNCNSVNIYTDISLQSNPGDLTNVEWFYEQQKGPVNVSCTNSKNSIQLKNLGNGSSYNVPSQILQSLKFGINIVAKGYKYNDIGYDCQYFKFQNNPNPNSNLPTPNCEISPVTGDIFTPFTVNCTVNTTFCSAQCSFYLTTSKDKYVYQGNQDNMPNLFLPRGNITLIVTVKNKAHQTISTTLDVQVTDSRSWSAGAVRDTLQRVVTLQKPGVISVPMLAQLFETISDNMGSNLSQDDKKQLLEFMSTSLLDAMTSKSTDYLLDEITVLASSVLSFVTHENLLTPNTTATVCTLLDDISKDLISSSDGNSNETSSAALPIVLSSSILLKHSAANDQKTSETLLRIMDQVQSALLTNKSINMEPILLSSPLIDLYVNRLTPDYLFEYPIMTENISVAFTLPSSVLSLVPLDEPVNLRMMSFGINPYAWNKEKDISGTVGSLSLSSDDGSVIPVENLNEEIEILLTRLGVVDTNQTFLNLTSYSTMAISVTAPNTSLVLKLEPSDETPLMLHLGFQYHPNDTNYVAKFQFPQAGDSQAGEYTWVLTPKDVALEVGIYYLLVRPIVPAGVNSTNVTVFITSIAANCKYWNESVNRWNEYGCRVGPLTTSLVTQCLCTHLTSFGSSFFVMPNTVDVSQTAALFSTFANNPVVVCFVGAIFLVYIITAIWAHKKDLQDKIKVRITVLEDIDPLAEYRYLVAVTTGHRHGAATTSNVTLTLIGTVWESKPHHLTDPEKPVFTRGAVDIFMLTTPFSLGDLHSIRLWHDNSGENPDWYVNKVMVQDLETGEMWHFLCNSWMAIDNGDCTLDKVFTIASETDLKGFHNLFFTKTVKDLCDGHIWYSVVNRPASSNFTRVQRLSCCFSLLLCTMLTSIMFWGIPKNPSEQDMELGTITFNLQQVMIGIQSSIIMFPVNLLIVTIFRSTRPRKKKEVSIIQQSKSGSSKDEKKLAERWRIQTDVTVEIVVKELKKIVCALAKAVKCPVPSPAEESATTDINTLLFAMEDIIRQENFNFDKFNVKDMENENLYVLYWHYLCNHLWNLEKELRLLDPSQFPKPEDYIQAVLQVQSMKLLLEPYLYSKPMGNKVHITGPEEEQKKKWYQKGLPWWFVIVGWILIAATSGVSAYFTMMYGLTYGKQRSISWLISISVSFFESLFVTQPIKVLGLAVFFALVVKRVENQDENMFHLLKDMTLTYSEDPDDVRISRRDSTCRFYQPPPPADVKKMKENYIKNQKAVALIKEIIIYFAFLCVLLLTTYGQRDPNAYYLTRHIQQSFSTGITDSMSPGDVFNWANNVLISNLFGQRPGFITDGNSKLVGSARLRQVRVLKDSCRISKAMQQAVYDCNAPYTWAVEDMGSYGPSWNHSKDVNISTTLLIPWQYQTQSKLRGHPIWGTMAFYRGGGFVLDLGLDPQQASSMLQYLFDNTWLDVYTRAIFVEFTVYNANVNLFCIVTLMLETTALGAFQYSSELHILRLYQTTDGINIVASEVIYFLFILYYMFLQIKRIKHQKLQYFRSKYNLLDLSIILLSLAALGAIVNRTIQGNKDLQYFQENRNDFPSFCDTASADSCLGYILAFLILLGTVKMWHLMRLNSKMNLIICALQRAWNGISSFIIVLIIMLLAYALVSNLLFGWILYTYRTVQDSMLAIIALQLGIFNYEEVLDLHPVLGAFLILSCVILMTFVVLNFFISVVLEAFSQKRKHYKPSEEEEIADLMTRKICEMFGITVKKKC